MSLSYTDLVLSLVPSRFHSLPVKELFDQIPLNTEFFGYMEEFSCKDKLELKILEERIFTAAF